MRVTALLHHVTVDLLRDSWLFETQSCTWRGWHEMAGIEAGGTDADRFRKSLGERLRKFGLELHPEKTRRIEFGRYAEQNRKRRGEGKPETFDFLGLHTERDV